MSYIDFDHITKEYNSGGSSIFALKDASFSVEKGELAVILGASGAGKTTALNILGGMDTATSGKVLVDGADVTAFWQTPAYPVPTHGHRFCLSVLQSGAKSDGIRKR